MKTTAERLRWALQFAHKDLTGLSTKEWERLRDELRHFLGTRRGTHGPPLPLKVGTTLPLKDILVFPMLGEAPWPLEFTPEDFARLQTEIKEMLLGLADWPFVDGITQEKTLNVTYLLNLTLSRYTGRYTLNFSGTTHDMVLLVLFHLIAQVPADSFRRCPECHAVFVRVKRQLYCSMRCSKRANMRAWRYTPQGQKYSQAQARKRYEQKVQKTHPGARPRRYNKRTAAATR